MRVFEDPPLWRRKWFRATAFLFVFLFAGMSFLNFTFIETWNYRQFDFYIFYDAAVALSQGDSPYSEILDPGPDGSDEEMGWGRYIYPPFYARILYPLTFVDMMTARHIYLVLSILGYFGLLFLFPRRNPSVLLAWAVNLFLLFSWGPTVLTFRWAQSNFVILFLFVASWALLNKEREFLAGIPIGLAAMIKLNPILIAPVFWVCGRWKVLAGMATGILFAVAIGGIEETWVYFTQVLPVLRDFPQIPECPTINMAATRTLVALASPSAEIGEPFPGWISSLGLFVSLFFYLSVLVATFQRRQFLDAKSLLLLGCFLPPLLGARWPHHYMLVLLPILVLVDEILEAECKNLPARIPIWVWPLFAFALLPNFNYLLDYWLSGFSDYQELIRHPPVALTPLIVWGNLMIFLIAFWQWTSRDNRIGRSETHE